MIFYVITDFIGITSSIIYSKRGKGFRYIIDELRKLCGELKGDQKDFRPLYLFIIIFYLFTLKALYISSAAIITCIQHIDFNGIP